ncbi:histidinol-phosphatase [Treponema brennaborense]|uniref:Histidinol-phosphatase n=1 Tax=Treponema brennaborense (strain DSM 12168 / CIP 105900 / DD5/3) TaxID=906968 RepID=F4LPE8_TREBD|nr:histidinol-phosphatase [Treponema brennaborense]AEE15959.1 histidinol phosphate phosphatase HisJ family protein [Treponema brennaborense DSM 12168]
MLTNFHTHTFLCHHAEGTVSDYVAAAQASGCDMLGFSDHCPYPRDGNDTWPGIRMTPEEAVTYVSDVRNAAAAFPVYLGFECEYDAEYASWYADELKGRFGADYLVLGAHWVCAGNERLYIPDVHDRALIRQYFDTVIEGMRTGLYSFLAHPDLIMADGRCWDAELESHFSELIDAAVSCGLPLEVNGVGLARRMVAGERGLRHPYPVDEFWELAAKKNAAVVCNADAHRPQDVIANAVLARNFAARFGITPLETIFPESR